MARGKGRKPTSQETKAGLKVLKAKGLYKGDLRKPQPTRYATKLVEEYRDVISGRAQVIKIGRSPTGRNKGIAAAKAKARELSSEYTKTVRSKGERIIVRTGRPDEKVYYSPAADTIVTQYRDAMGRKIEHEYVRQGTKREDLEEEYEGEPDQLAEAQADNLPNLKPGQTYALPLSQGYGGVHYEMRATKQEILDLAFQYEAATKRLKSGRVVSNPYRDAVGHIQVVTIDAPKRRRKRQPPKKRVSRTKRASNVVPFRRPQK